MASEGEPLFYPSNLRFVAALVTANTESYAVTDSSRSMNKTASARASSNAA
jgi:hypothetical protein